MKWRLPILGTQVKIGKDAEDKEAPKIKAVSEVLGGFLDFGSTTLSNEKQISSKLIKANTEWVYINVSTLADIVSSIEFDLFQFRMVNGQVELEPIEEHEILDLLDKFNETTTKNDAIYNTEAHMDLAGEAFWYLDGGDNGKKPENIFLIQPDNVELKLGDFTDASARLVDEYVYKVNIDGKTIEKQYSPDEIIHIKVPNPGNPYRGYSAIEALASTIDTDNFAQEALRNLFKNGMIGDFFLTTDNRLNADQLKNLAAQFRAAYTGVKNFWKVPILFGGIKPEKLMSTGREMQLIELEEWFRNKIMAAFNNTRASLGLDDEVNRSTSESSLLHWKRNVIAPKMARIVNSLNEYLVPRYGENLLLGFKDPVPEDRESEMKEAIELFKAKLITKNEARQIIDYDEVEGGDEFETVTVNPLQPLPEQMPKSLKYVNYRQVFRKANVFKMAKEYNEIKREAIPLARKLIKSRKHKEDTEEIREHSAFSNEQVWDYWEKQINLVNGVEDIFQNYAEQFSKEIVENGLKSLDDPDKRAQGDLVDKEELIDMAVNKFSVPLNEILILSGQLANRLIGVDDPYIPTKAVDTRAAIRQQIELFAASMIDTDLDIMTEILAAGLDEELSIPQIRRQIEEKFEQYNKTQAERITRTEVLKTSNLGAQDAFEQSGVVVAKQWLTAMDDRTDPLCASLNGKIIDLRSDYFKKGDSVEIGDRVFKLNYSDTPYPPIHVSCRCTLLPIIEGQDDFDIRSYDSFQNLKARINELESQADKRTKAFKELQKEKQDTQEYANALERLVDES